MEKNHLKVNEIFTSILGESSYSGYPFIFIRLSGCNLNCGYCDTEYAREEGKLMVIDEIVDIVRGYGLKKILITGGEPLLQKNTIKLMEKLIEERFTILLETNGSVNLKDVPEDVIKIVDVKTPGSFEPDTFLMKNLKYIKRGDEVKFVITSTQDFYWAKRFVTDFLVKKHIIVLFSPAYGIFSPKTLSQLILKEKLNVRLNIQIHKIIGIK